MVSGRDPMPSNDGLLGKLADSGEATVAESDVFLDPTRPRVPGYDLVRELGRGGMGIVWEAIEHRLERPVALKVRMDDVGEDDASAAALWAEARLAARVADPGVVPVHDVGRTLDGRPFYTMELVAGTDLGAVLKDGALPEARAVRIAAEIARAVAAAHEAGIIHRDLKSRNVMIDRSGRARVLDFGLALRLSQDGTAGASFAGSPSYMAPEQLSGEPLGPPTDVHAIGVLLYEMLTGRRPYAGENHAAVLYAVLQLQPEPPSKLVPTSPAVERVCLRCLEKDPKRRFASARPLADALGAILEGKPLPDDVSPSKRVPHRPAVVPTRSDRPRIEDAKRVFTWSWSLRASPAALWPFVSDTDRFNENVGLGPVFVDDGRIDAATVARAGRADAAGFSMAWREYPFEWIREREHSVFRWYSEGPLSALWNKVTLTPRADGGTDLTHEIAVVPRGVLGRVAVLFEIGQRLRRAIDRVYRALDDALAAGTDPWTLPFAPNDGQRARVEAGARALGARGFDRIAIDALARTLLAAPTRDLARMRPLELARRWGIPNEVALDLMIHAAEVGLLDLGWDLICPTCMIAHESAPSLGAVKHTGHCHTCEVDYERDLGRSVELVFHPHAEVRETKPQTFCAGSPAKKPHVVAQFVLEAGADRTLVVPLAAGEYAVSCAGHPHAVDLAASHAGHQSDAELVVTEGAIGITPRVVRAGEVMLRIVNDTNAERLLRIETRSSRHDSVPATRALTHPAFRQFFSRELFAHGELFGVSRLAFLTVDASDSGALYAARGDSEACNIVRGSEAAFGDVVRAEQGTVLPGPLGSFVAAFPTPLRALRAALELVARTDAPLRIGLHGGQCLALTRDARIEYFGETLHRAFWLAQAAQAGQIVLSQACADDEEVARALATSRARATVGLAGAGPYAGRRVVTVTAARSGA
jgi:serine/threonine protein kinase